MIVRRRVICYGAICLVTFIVLCAVFVKIPGILPWGRMIVAPASLDGIVTMSSSPDKELTFITCAPDHPSLWRRLLHSTLSGAFVVQHNGPKHNVVAHSGSAHIEFQGNLLSVVFADSSRFVFTTQPREAIPLAEGEVEGVGGIITYSMPPGLGTHAAFVASRDWTKRGCGL